MRSAVFLRRRLMAGKAQPLAHLRACLSLPSELQEGFLLDARRQCLGLPAKLPGPLSQPRFKRFRLDHATPYLSRHCHLKKLEIAKVTKGSLREVRAGLLDGLLDLIGQRFGARGAGVARGAPVARAAGDRRITKFDPRQ